MEKVDVIELQAPSDLRINASCQLSATYSVVYGD